MGVKKTGTGDPRAKATSRATERLYVPDRP